jgi:hypothetical protein
MARVQIERIIGTWTTLTPVFHFGTDDTGIGPTNRRMDLWDSNVDEVADVPCISANAVRGVLRRIIMADFLELVGYEVESPKLHHALCSGGQLESTDDNTSSIDMAMRRALIEGIPPLGLLGTSIGNQILTSCLQVDHAMPVCEERKWQRDLRRKGTLLQAPDCRLWDDDPRWEQSGNRLTSRHFYTRRDDLHADRDDDAQAVQMLVEPECIVPGALFEHGFALKNASAVESGCLGRALELWAIRPTIGGKASGGFGQLLLDYDHIPDSSPYLAWCAENVDLAVDALNLIVNPPKAAKRAKKSETEEGASSS